tara:strand:- start:208 stop:1005 length:798 start_codon:yes stop_codon:yes gene_type:complete
MSDFTDFFPAAAASSSGGGGGGTIVINGRTVPLPYTTLDDAPAAHYRNGTFGGGSSIYGPTTDIIYPITTELTRLTGVANSYTDLVNISTSTNGGALLCASIVQQSAVLQSVGSGGVILTPDIRGFEITVDGGTTKTYSITPGNSGADGGAYVATGQMIGNALVVGGVPMSFASSTNGGIGTTLNSLPAAATRTGNLNAYSTKTMVNGFCGSNILRSEEWFSAGLPWIRFESSLLIRYRILQSIVQGGNLGLTSNIEVSAAVIEF